MQSTNEYLDPITESNCPGGYISLNNALSRLNAIRIDDKSIRRCAEMILESLADIEVDDSLFLTAAKYNDAARRINAMVQKAKGVVV